MTGAPATTARRSSLAATQVRELVNHGGQSGPDADSLRNGRFDTHHGTRNRTQSPLDEIPVPEPTSINSRGRSRPL